jgi:hypothetical protein
VARPPLRCLEEDFYGVIELPQKGLLGNLAAIAIPPAFLFNFCGGLFEEANPIRHRSDR